MVPHSLQRRKLLQRRQFGPPLPLWLRKWLPCSSSFKQFWLNKMFLTKGSGGMDGFVRYAPAPSNGPMVATIAALSSSFGLGTVLKLAVMAIGPPPRTKDAQLENVADAGQPVAPIQGSWRRRANVQRPFSTKCRSDTAGCSPCRGRSYVGLGRAFRDNRPWLEYQGRSKARKDAERLGSAQF